MFPKSTNPERIRSNLKVFDFSLDEDEMSAIRALDKGKGVHDPDKPGIAIVSCNDDLRPVIMKHEATDEESRIDYEPVKR